MHRKDGAGLTLFESSSCQYETDRHAAKCSNHTDVHLTFTDLIRTRDLLPQRSPPIAMRLGYGSDGGPPHRESRRSGSHRTL
jgi:hypothetical protein